MAEIDNKYYNYEKFHSFGPIVKFDDIKPGTIYHIPPTIIYGRRDFICETKYEYSAVGQIRNGEDKPWKSYTLSRTELAARFIVEKQPIRDN